jgi:hypothetical protein
MPHRALIAFAALLLAAPCAARANSLDNPNVPTGEGDAIFAIGEGGFLEPIGIRRHGTFIDPGSADGGPSEKLRTESNAVVATNGNRVHVIFGGRVVATVPAKIANGAATIAIPPSLHLNGNVEALASPTLGGHAAKSRRAPTASERAAALAVAARTLGTTSARLVVDNLTALDLGRGTAFAGTVKLRGSGTPRTDKRLFFIAEPVGGALRATLVKPQTIKMVDPMLEYVGEHLVDAIDLGDGALSVVTRVLGYDAHTFAIYSRTQGGWKQVYTGGGAAL